MMPREPSRFGSRAQALTVRSGRDLAGIRSASRWRRRMDCRRRERERFDGYREGVAFAPMLNDRGAVAHADESRPPVFVQNGLIWLKDTSGAEPQLE